MSASNFEIRIRARFQNAKVEFTHEYGKHMAFFPDDDVRIIGNYASRVATVNWGSGHCAQFAL